MSAGRMGIFGAIANHIKKRNSPFGLAQAKIYSSSSVQPRLADLCERALAAGTFSVHGQMPNADHVIAFSVDGLTYVGLVRVQTVEVFGGALIVEAVYSVGKQGLTALIADLKSA